MKFISILLLTVLLPFLAASPLTLAKKNTKSSKYITSLKFSQTFSESLRKQNESSRKRTSIIVKQHFTYTPRSNMELLISGKGSYQRNDRVGLIGEEQTDTISLENFWIGMNYMNFFSMPSSFSNLPFELFEPTLHISGGGLKNATAYFIKISLGLNLTQHAYISTAWQQSFYQANPKEIGWRNSKDNYSIINTSIEYTHKITPLLRISFLNAYKQEREQEHLLKRYWLLVKKIF